MLLLTFHAEAWQNYTMLFRPLHVSSCELLGLRDGKLEAHLHFFFQEGSFELAGELKFQNTSFTPSLSSSEHLLYSDMDYLQKMDAARSLFDTLVGCYLQNNGGNHIEYIAHELPLYDEQRSIRSNAAGVAPKPDLHRTFITLRLSEIDSFMIDGDKQPMFDLGGRLSEGGVFVGIGVWQGESTLLAAAGAL